MTPCTGHLAGPSNSFILRWRTYFLQFTDAQRAAVSSPVTRNPHSSPRSQRFPVQDALSHVYWAWAGETLPRDGSDQAPEGWALLTARIRDSFRNR